MNEKEESRPGEPGPQVRYWLDEIAASRKREKDFRKEGEEVLEIYCGKKVEEIPFNILYSNTETLSPALFSAIPRPVVQRRFKDDDPMGKAAGTAGHRVLEFLIDTNMEGYETFEQACNDAVMDGLLPGRGVTCVKYEADIKDVPQGEGEETLPVKQWESVCTESKSWNRVFFGYARKWSKVPWIAFEEHMDRDEAERLFGEEIAGKIVYTTGDDTDEDNERKSGDEKDTGERKTAIIYQIWDKEGGKKIRYVSPQYIDDLLKVEDDPLGITGFYNIPRPLQFLRKSNDMLPVALYKLYENQARELNKITVRINRLVDAMKVRGAYDGALGEEIENILKQEENGLVPTDKGASLAAEGGLDKAIWLMPLEKLIIVLRELISARMQAKQTIYEITGIADIMRGQTQASETLGAQEIKQQWGTLRLKRMQREVSRYARDLLRIMLDIAAAKFSERTFALMTGLPFATSEQKAQAQMIMQAAQAQGTQPDPQTMQIMQAPGWKDVLTMLRDDVQRAYRIDIETNSTVDLEATEDQKNIAEVMNAIAQFMNGVGPMVEKGVMPFEVAKGMLLAVVRRYRFGSDIEDSLKAMKPPAPPQDPNAGKMKIEQQKAELEQQKGAHELRIAQEQAQLQSGVAAQQAKLDTQRMRLEMQAMQEEHAVKMAELRAKAQYNLLMAELKEKQLKQKMVADEAKAKQAAEKPEKVGV